GTTLSANYDHAQAAVAITEAVTLVVNDVGDESDANAGDGECATAGAVCTLRAALEEANALAGAEVINFDLPIPASISASSDELLIT
ncbi:MAG: CSLREA domain-containing protein, partial [Caldilineaceae bacterium]|nr:CSLREA domain-containing protein [Caldilineaceae bacterium]